MTTLIYSLVALFHSNGDFIIRRIDLSTVNKTSRKKEKKAEQGEAILFIYLLTFSLVWYSTFRAIRRITAIFMYYLIHVKMINSPK